MNAMLELLGEMLGSVARFALDLIGEKLVEPLLSSQTFRDGYIGGVVTAGIIGFLARQTAYWVDKIRDFFKPSKDPATKEGPSQAAKSVSTFTGCTAAFGQLGFLLMIIVALITLVYLAILQAET